MTTSVWNDRSDIQAAGAEIENVDDFCYLGSYISYNGSCEKDVKVRIGKAAAVFGKMRKMWRNSNVSLKVKTRLAYMKQSSCQLSCTVLMYGIDSNINKKSECCTSQMAEEYTGHLMERQDN